MISHLHTAKWCLKCILNRMYFIYLLGDSSEAMKMEPFTDILAQHIVLGMNLEIFPFFSTCSVTSNLWTPLCLIW